MLGNSRNSSNIHDKQIKLMQERISSVEKHFGNLCNAFSAFGRKEARVRDSGDNLSKAIKTYSSEEIMNKSLSKTLSNLSTSLSAIEDYRNAYVQRMEVKVVGELSHYETICKHAKVEMKHMQSLRDSELNKKQLLDRIKDRNPLGRQQIVQAEVELLKASVDTSRTAKDIEDQMDAFEKQKLKDIKNLLKTFIEIGLVFHSKTLELLTIAHQQVLAMDEIADLNVFQDTRGQLELEYRTALGTGNDTQKESRSSLASLLEQEVPQLRNANIDKSDFDRLKKDSIEKYTSEDEDSNDDDDKSHTTSDSTD